ncbi:MAG: hypothetical protein U9Q22_02575 [Candidatus Altiarchaeota archaeon]|nr:hypothetical protein [Candidatus Altiarchaeota archaeon]
MEGKKTYTILKILDSVGSVKGRTKLQKLIFLGQEEAGLHNLFSYRPYHYGPYSQELTGLIDELKLGGYVEEKCRVSDDFIEYEYNITPKGREQLSSLEKQHRNEISSKTIRKIKKLNKQSRNEIISYVYRKYLDNLQ